MRRPHVYERSVPRARRDAYREPDGDRLRAARAILRALQPLTASAEAAGLVTLVNLLEDARREAERAGDAAIASRPFPPDDAAPGSGPREAE